MLKSPRLKGQEAEKHARAFLEKQGLTFLAQNYEKSFGEIDLIMRDQSTLVFAEVRARSDFRHTHPFETVDLNKQARIIRTAEYYLSRKTRGELPDCRFDVIAVNLSNGRIEWLRDAFEA